jgi:hypothetical protein
MSESDSKTIATAEPVRALMVKVAGMGFPMSVFLAFGPGETGKGTMAATHLHGKPGTDFAALIRLAISSLEHDLAVMEADDKNEPPAGAGGFLN